MVIRPSQPTNEQIRQLLEPYENLKPVLHKIRTALGHQDHPEYLPTSLVHLHEVTKSWQRSKEISADDPWVHTASWIKQLPRLIRLLESSGLRALPDNPWETQKAKRPLLYVLCQPKLINTIGDRKFNARTKMVLRCFRGDFDPQTFEDIEDDCRRILKIKRIRKREGISRPGPTGPTHRTDPTPEPIEEIRPPQPAKPDQPKEGLERLLQRAGDTDDQVRLRRPASARTHDHHEEIVTQLETDRLILIDDTDPALALDGSPSSLAVITVDEYDAERPDDDADATSDWPDNSEWIRDQIQGITEYYAKAGQYVVWSVNQLDHYQTSLLFARIQWIDTAENEDHHNPLGALLVWFMLFTPLSLEALAKLPILDASQPGPLPTCYLTTDGVLVLPCPIPLNAARPDPDVLNQVWPREHVITLQLRGPFPNLLQRAFDQIQTDDSLQATSLSQLGILNAHEVLSQYRATLESFRKYDEYLTPGRVEHALYYQCLQVTGHDFAQGYWLAGKHDGLARPSPYYRNMPLSVLQQTYQNICQHMTGHAHLFQTEEDFLC